MSEDYLGIEHIGVAMQDLDADIHTSPSLFGHTITPKFADHALLTWAEHPTAEQEPT